MTADTDLASAQLAASAGSAGQLIFAARLRKMAVSIRSAPATVNTPLFCSENHIS